jgi:hypothetical protein
VVLLAGYFLRRFPSGEWRLRMAITASVLLASNIVVFQYGTIAQPYALCLLAMVAAFRLAVSGADRGSLWLMALAGVASGAAAASTLLSAPFGPVLLIWLAVRAQAGRRIAACAALVAGELVGLGPLLVDLVRWPRQVVFDVIGYHVFYRQVDWDGWWSHDLILFTSWLDSVQVFLLLGLAIGGLVFVRRSGWDFAVRSEYYLCVWLAATLSLSGSILSWPCHSSRYWRLPDATSWCASRQSRGHSPRCLYFWLPASAEPCMTKATTWSGKI